MTRQVVVADCSVTGAWFLPDEASEAAVRLLGSVLDGAVELAQPVLWYYESVNLLRSAVLRRRLTLDAATEAVALWREIQVTWYAPRPSDVGELFADSWATGLSAYDASYLSLARKLNCPLLTEDAALLKVAATGVSVKRVTDWLG